MKTLIAGGRLISPGWEMAAGSVLIEDGRIAAVIDGGERPPADRVVEAGGRMILPGFIDIHSHGADGCDVCDGELDGIRHIAERKLREGVTTWLPTTLTQPRDRLRAIVGCVADYVADPALTRCPGLHIEGPFIHADKAGAQNPEFVRPPDFDELAELQAIAPVLICSLAPDVPGALDCIQRATAAGILCSAAHTAATYAQLMAGKAAGLRHVTHFGNAMTPLHHREIGVVGGGLLDDELRLELIGDTIHLCPEMLRLIFSRVAIERLMLITDSMAASWIDHGEVMLGGLEVVVQGGTARLKQGGALAGSTLRFNHGLRHLVEQTGRPLTELVRTTSWNQAQALGLDGFGRLEPGYWADLVTLDETFEVWKTWVGGEER